MNPQPEHTTAGDGEADRCKTVPVSCVVPTYNRGRILIDTLADLLAQAPAPLEIICVDQTEAHEPEVEEQLTELAAHPLLRYIRVDFANAQMARNRGIAEAKAEVVILTDDDVRMGPGFAAAHWRNYADDPTIDAIAGQILLPGEGRCSKFPKRYYWPCMGWSFFLLNYDTRCDVINLSSCNMSVRRSKALEIGGFDEWYTHTWHDDADFAWRLHLAGGRVVFDPLATLTHLLTPMGGKRPGGVNEHLTCNRDRWTVLFYFWLTHFGLKAWRDIWRHLRMGLVRRAVLVRPWLWPRGAADLLGGMREARRRIKVGPKLPFAARR